MAKFTIPGKPQGKARPRVYRNPNTGLVHGVTPRKTQDYESLIRLCYKNQVGVYFYDMPIRMSVTAVYSVPKNYNKAKREKALKGDISPKTKPDLDNIAKVVLDALNEIAYKDDNQVVQLEVKKIFGNTPCVIVDIYAL